MNATTQSIIEFLSYPELRFGTEEDLQLLDEPEHLCERVYSLLDEPRAFLSREEAEQLQANLSDADWPMIASEFATRVNMAARFFDGDAQAGHSAHQETAAAGQSTLNN